VKRGIIAGLGFLAVFFLAAVAVYPQQQQSKILKDLASEEKEYTVETVAGASVYKLPLIGKINVKEAELFPHYRPKKKAAGWLHAYAEAPTPTLCVLMIEEIPPHSNKLIGRKETGAYTFLGVSGKGYVEFRDDASKPGKGFVWEEKSFFYKPFASWYGFANPFDKPARIVTLGCHLDHDIINPYLGNRIRTVRDLEIPGERRTKMTDDTVIENLDWAAILKMAEPSSSPHVEIAKRGDANTVQVTQSTAPFDVARMEWPIYFFKLRADEGWRGVNAEPARDMNIRSLFNVFEEMPPHSSEIGHKHGGGLWFVCLKGKGYMGMRATTKSSEARLYWGEWDMWVMPWMTAAGTWHSHANPYDEPARFMGLRGPVLEEDAILDASREMIHMETGDGVNTGSPDNVFRKRGEAPQEGK